MKVRRRNRGSWWVRSELVLAAAFVLVGCAARPVNLPLTQIDPTAGYRSGVHPVAKTLLDTQILITFSGGGTRAAAFSYGVLEELRRTSVEVKGRPARLVDEIDFIAGVSGGSFTALAFGLRGEKLFDDFDTRFLKRDVQGDLIKRFLNPLRWPRLASSGYGRSELAADYYDEVLFDGATFGDLVAKPGPLVLATATDISTGSRFAFAQSDFDVICSDLSSVRLSRAAATSSAVPVVFSPVAFDNYGGHCGYAYPSWADAASSTTEPVGRLAQRQRELRSFENSADRPFLHLVDGGVSDNLGLRTILERFQEAEFSEAFRQQLHIERLRRTLVIVVNSRSDPSTDWDRSERGPSSTALLLQSLSVPIDRNSYETIELLRDMTARWKTNGELNKLRRMSKGEPAESEPQPRFFTADISFEQLTDASERQALMGLPTSFSLPSDDVDHLRLAAARLLRSSPGFQAFLDDLRRAP